MAPRPKKRATFEVNLTDEDQQALTSRLAEEIVGAQAARAKLTDDHGLLDYFNGLYEQFRTRTATDRPWPGAADLTSYIGTEKVDSLRARAVKAVYVEPVWTVEGSGADAERATLVEEFHAWKAEEERLQGFLSDAVHNSLIERVGVLEVAERADKRKVRIKAPVKVVTDEAGMPVLDAKLEPQPVRDEAGAFIPAEAGEAAADLEREDIQVIHRGPKYTVVPLKDFLVLPGHAKHKDEIWGYAKRCYLRIPTLEARQKDGIYQNVDRLTRATERTLTTAEIKSGQELASQKGASVEKEIWEVDLLADLDKDGWEEWYKITLSIQARVLLRVQRDDIGRHPYFLFTCFRNPKSWMGYSYIEKLVTIIEEHTALRNMTADRSALAANAPIQKRQGAPWEPDDEPFGPGQTITVSAIDQDLKQLQISDVPVSLIQQQRDVLQAAERVGGQADMMSGVQASESRTLGENQMAMAGSLIRVEEVVRNLQETMEELGAYRNLLWIRALADEKQGVQPPQGIVDALTFKGQMQALPDQRFTADLLRGNFRFKPSGSVESADPAKMRADYNAFMQIVAGLTKGSPAVSAWLNHPETLKALIEQAVRLFHFPNRAALLKSLSQVLMQQQQAAQMQALLPPGMSSMPPGGGGVPPNPALMLPPGGPLPPGRPPVPGGGPSAPPVNPALARLRGPGGPG